MVARPLGLYLWFGIPMPLAKRLQAIRQAGFTSVSLWWDVRRGMVRERLHALPGLVREAGLQVENAHLPFAKCNQLWSEDAAVRDAAVSRYLEWLDECAEQNVPLLVMHVCSGDTPPAPTPAGVAGITRIVEEAAARGITIAVENTRKPAYVELALDEIASPHLGWCYDSSHGRLWGTGDLLRRHGSRLAAVHFSDNDGKADRHWLPGDGVIDWPAVLRDFPRETYSAPITLEVVVQDKHAAPYDFLERACEKARWLSDLVRTGP